MLNSLVSMFSHMFILKALVVGIFTSVAAALLGTILVLKRYSMIGDGLSHVSFSAYTVAVALNFFPVFFSIPVVVLLAIFLLWFSDTSKIEGDAAIALVSNSFLSFGIVVVSLTTGMNNSVLGFMFGSVLAIGISDLILSVVFSILVVLFFVVFYNKLFAVTFDENFAKAVGIKTKFYSFLVAVLVAILVSVGIKVVGALLMASLIVFPVLTSMKVFSKFKLVAISSAVVSVFCFVLGLIFSYVLALPTGATVVLANLCLFLSCSLISFLRNRLVG